MNQKVMKAGWVVLAVMVAIVVFGPDPDVAKKAEAYKAMPIEEKIKSMSDLVVEVDEVVKGEVLMITFFKPAIWDGKNWTWNFLETAKTVLSRLEEASQGVPYKRVTFMAQIPTKNNLGQEDKQLAMKVTYHLEKMAGAKWDNMTAFDIAELADDVEFRPLGTDAVMEYCKGNATFAKRFCGKAAVSASKLHRY